MNIKTNMNKDQTYIDVIAKQALRIHELEELANSFDEDMKKIHSLLYEINGPLNGNKLGYTEEQLKIFLSIAHI